MSTEDGGNDEPGNDSFQEVPDTYMPDNVGGRDDNDLNQSQASEVDATPRVSNTLTDAEKAALRASNEMWVGDRLAAQADADEMELQAFQQEQALEQEEDERNAARRELQEQTNRASLHSSFASLGGMDESNDNDSDNDDDTKPAAKGPPTDAEKAAMRTSNEMWVGDVMAAQAKADEFDLELDQQKAVREEAALKAQRRDMDDRASQSSIKNSLSDVNDSDDDDDDNDKPKAYYPPTDAEKAAAKAATQFRKADILASRADEAELDLEMFVKQQENEQAEEAIQNQRREFQRAASIASLHASLASLKGLDEDDSSDSDDSDDSRDGKPPAIIQVVNSPEASASVLGNDDAAEMRPLACGSKVSLVGYPHDTRKELEVTMEEAMDRLGTGLFQRRLLIATGLNQAAESIEIVLLSFLALVIQSEFQVEADQGSWMTTVVFIGAAIGTLFFGVLGDTYGRRPAFMASCIIISVAGVMSALARYHFDMLASRAIVGFGIGGIVVSFDLLAEYLPSQDRGTYIFVQGIFWSLGSILVPLLAFFGLHAAGSWRLFVLLCSIPCFISTIFVIMWVPESSRWLVANGRHEEALVIMREAAIINGKDPLTLFPEGTIFIQAPEEEKGMHSVLCFFKKEWRSLMAALWGLNLMLAFLYLGPIQLVTLVFTEYDGQGGYIFDYFAIFASATAEIAGCFLDMALMSFGLGRVPSISALMIMLGIFTVSVCLVADDSAPNRSGLIVLTFLMRMYAMSVYQLIWLLTAEMIPTKIRNSGHSACLFFTRLGGAATPWFVNAATPYRVIGLTMGALSLLSSFLVSTLPETAGKAMGTAPLHDIGLEKPQKATGEIV